VQHLPFYTRPFRYSRRNGRLYRLGDIRLWPFPWRLYAIKAGLWTLAVTVLAGRIVGLPVQPYGWMVYLGVPAAAAWLACQEVADGKLGHEYLASRLAVRFRRVGLLPVELERVRPTRRVRTTASPWMKDQP